MHPWRGIVCHALLISAQPMYLAIRHWFDPEYFGQYNALWITLHAVAFIFVFTRFTLPFINSPLGTLPYPANDVFPIGHLNFNGGKPLTALVERILETPNDGIVNLWMPLYAGCQIVPTTPETVMELLNTRSYDWVKPTMETKLLRGFIGNGLVTVEGQEHKDMRKVVAPAFAGRHLRDLAPLFYGKALESGDFMAEELSGSGGEALDIVPLMSRITLDIICAAAVGRDFHTVEKTDTSLAEHYNSLIHADRGPPWLFVVVLLLVPSWLVKYLKGTPYAKIAAKQDALRVKVRELLAEKKESMKAKGNEQDKDIIAIIMRSGNLSDDYLVGQLLTFLAAGHDTTASALSWALYLASQHPELQDRLRAECKTELSEKNPSDIGPSTFDADQMPYLSAFCHETLRLYPPASAGSRVSVRDTTLGVHKIPAGTQALIPIWAIQRSSDFWGSNATQFDPDRWLDGPDAANGGATSSHAFLSFFHGPRSCIGQGFARLEMKSILAALILRFSFELADPSKRVEVGGFLISKPDGGLKLKLTDLRKDASPK